MCRLVLLGVRTGSDFQVETVCIDCPKPKPRVVVVVVLVKGGFLTLRHCVCTACKF